MANYINPIIVCLVAVLITGCVTHPGFYRASLKSRMNNKFHYNVQRSDSYCPKTDEKGRHVKSEDGYKYQEVCTDSNGNKLYLSKQKAISGLAEIVKAECEKQNLKYKFVGQENIKEFVKMSDSRCRTKVTEDENTSSYGIQRERGVKDFRGRVVEKEPSNYDRRRRKRLRNRARENKDYTSSYGHGRLYEDSGTANYQNSNTSKTGYSTTTCSESFPIYRHSTDLHYLCESK